MRFRFYILFTNNSIREQLDENDFRRYYGKFFSKMSFQKYLITAVFKVLSQVRVLPQFTITRHLENGFERRNLKDTLQLKILRTWINMGVKLAPRYLTYYCMFILFVLESLDLKFNLVLIEKFSLLFIFLPLDILLS